MAPPPPYGAPAPQPYGGYGTSPPHQYGGYGPPPPPRRKSAKGWLIGGCAAAVIFVGLGVINAVGGVGPRDEQSYQAGRSVGDVGRTMVKFGGATPEDYCKQRFTLSTPLGEKSKYRRGDYMDGCLDALEEKLNGKS